MLFYQTFQLISFLQFVVSKKKIMMRLTLSIAVVCCLTLQAEAFLNFGKSGNNQPTKSNNENIGGKPNFGYVNGIRGISALEKEVYNAASEFKCDGGKTVIPFNWVNDDFCDCTDGSDEPGTSACAKSTFQCLNKGFKMVAIPSSRVDDGICDCCDGSDEGLSTQSCPNTCDVHASKQRALMEKVVNAYKAGHSVRTEYSTAASTQYSNALAAIDVLKNEEAVLREEKEGKLVVVQTEELLEKSETREKMLELNNQLDAVLQLNALSVEDLGRLLAVLLDVYKMNVHQVKATLKSMVFQDAKSASMVTNPVDSADYMDEDADVLQDFDDLDLDDELHDDEGTGTAEEANPDHAWVKDLSPVEESACSQLTNSMVESTLFPICQHQVPTGEGDAMSRPVLVTARNFVKELVGTKGGYKEVQYAIFGVLNGRGFAVQPEAVAAVGVKPDGEVQLVPDVQTNHFQKELVSKFVDTHAIFGAEECLSDVRGSSAAVCAMANELERVYQPHGYGSKLSYQRAGAVAARKAVKEVESLMTGNSKEKQANQDILDNYQKFSNYLPFLALSKDCFEVKEADKFVYKLCMFGTIQQTELQGSRNSVNLGNFERFSETSDGNIVMHFEKGQNCWAHGPRKADVTIVCGTSNILKEAREPSTCAYTMEFESPLGCTPKFAALNGIEV